MKKLLIISALFIAGIASCFAIDYTARVALNTGDQQNCILRESADPSVIGQGMSDNNNKGIAAYVNNNRYLQWGAEDFEGLALSVVVPANATAITINFVSAMGTPLYLVDASTGSRTLIAAGEHQDYDVDYESAAYAVNNRFSISKSATPPADTQELPSSLGTFVSDKKVASVTGAVLYEIIATDGVSNITFQEVNMTNGLAAGTPVLYQKTAATAYVTLGDEGSFNDGIVTANGFVGLLPGQTELTKNMKDGDLWALVSDGKLKFVDTYCTLTPGHAYIDMNAINQQQPAPGRRRLMIGRSGIVTDVENVAAEVKGARKSIENGKIVILKNGQKYNVAGQMMK